MEKTKINKKEAGIGPFKKNNVSQCPKPHNKIWNGLCMELFRRRRWRLAAAKVVSCCIYEMPKQKHSSWNTINKFVWQSGIYKLPLLLKSSLHGSVSCTFIGREITNFFHLQSLFVPFQTNISNFMGILCFNVPYLLLSRACTFVVGLDGKTFCLNSHIR